MVQRDTICQAAAAIFAAGVIWSVLFAGAAWAGEVGDDGLHKQPWFTVTFNDVAEDIETAKAEGKRLAIIFEQRGCSYCKKLHETVFSDPEVKAFIEKNFMVVQYNLYGAGDVTDLDGTTLTEKGAAKRWRVLFTPTVLFMPDAVPEDVATARDASVSSMPGAFQKGTVLHMFQWVRDRGYLTNESFQEFHARQLGGRTE
ncbi:MAG: thioredoxin family protein [Pseudomonadota bacterium]